MEKHLRLRVPEKLHYFIKRYALENNQTMHDVAVEALGKWMQQEQEKEKDK